MQRVSFLEIKEALKKNAFLPVHIQRELRSQKSRKGEIFEPSIVQTFSVLERRLTSEPGEINETSTNDLLIIHQIFSLSHADWSKLIT